MKWQEKTKEQKNIIMLVGLLTAALLFIIYQFGLNPLFSGKSRAAQALQDLKTKLADGENIAGREEKTAAELKATQEELAVADEKYIAPRENPLSWVTEKVYFSAREVGIDIDSVAEVGATVGSRDRAEKQQKIFTPYSVRIVAQCGYRDLTKLVESMEKHNPYLCVSGISISAQDRTVEKHLTSLVVEWPMRAAAATAKPAEATAPAPVL